jgi:antitoxin (DNA-binding transcriptional repressor) of toxin-antitoxin stability system
MPAGDIYAEQPPARAARVDGGMVLSELIASTKDGGVVYLTDDGDVVAAVAPIEVVEAGLRALGRDRDGHAEA